MPSTHEIAAQRFEDMVTTMTMVAAAAKEAGRGVAAAGTAYAGNTQVAQSNYTAPSSQDRSLS